jgi:hypothetical protein
MARRVPVTHALVHQPATPSAALSIPSSALLFILLSRFVGFHASSYFSRMDATPPFTRWGHACRQSQAAKGRPYGERAAHVGRDQGPEGGTSTPHLYLYHSRYSSLPPLALHYRCMRLKGPSNGLNALNPRPGKLSSSSRSVNGMHTMDGLS